MSTLLRNESFLSSIAVLREQLIGFPGVGWHSGQYAVEIGKRGSQEKRPGG